MKRSLLLRPFLLLLLSWFCTVAVSIAQTPTVDLDSITEDSYQRMLARQAAEQESDSLMASHAQSIVNEQLEEAQWQNYLLFIFVVFLIWLIIWYYRKVLKTGAKLKN